MSIVKTFSDSLSHRIANMCVKRFRHPQNSLHVTMLYMKSSKVNTREFKIHEAKAGHATDPFLYA